MAQPAGRQSDPHRAPEPPLRRQGLGRALRHARGPPRRAAAARPALDGNGVRLGDGVQGVPPRASRSSEIPIDYYPRIGESKLNRFGDAWRHVRFMLLYSPSWLYLVPGADPPPARARGHARARDRPRRRLRPHVADPHDARIRRADPDRRAGRPARRVRPHLCARPSRTSAIPSSNALRHASGSSTASCSAVGSSSPVSASGVGLREWAATASARSATTTRPRSCHALRARHPDRLRLVLPRAPDDALDELSVVRVDQRTPRCVSGAAYVPLNTRPYGGHERLLALAGSPKQVLDVGCSSGYLARRLAERGAHGRRASTTTNRRRRRRAQSAKRCSSVTSSRWSSRFAALLRRRALRRRGRAPARPRERSSPGCGHFCARAASSCSRRRTSRTGRCAWVSSQAGGATPTGGSSTGRTRTSSRRRRSTDARAGRLRVVSFDVTAPVPGIGAPAVERAAHAFARVRPSLLRVPVRRRRDTAVISVLIPVKNGGADLVRCLEAIGARRWTTTSRSSSSTPARQTEASSVRVGSAPRCTRSRRRSSSRPHPQPRRPAGPRGEVLVFTTQDAVRRRRALACAPHGRARDRRRRRCVRAPAPARGRDTARAVLPRLPLRP